MTYFNQTLSKVNDTDTFEQDTPTMDTVKTIYFIDGSAYIYRSFHALPMLTNSKGLPTNAILGFINILSKLIKEIGRAHV
jgi:5'-3' exonuclease